MITLPEEKVLYSEIQKKLFYIIPEKWDKIYLYASVVDIPNSRPKGEMYFYYLPKGIIKKKPVNGYEIPSLFDIDEEEYSKFIKDLYQTITNLRESLQKHKRKVWTNIVISIENFQFKIEFGYENLELLPFDSYERHIIWRYMYIDNNLDLYPRRDKMIIAKFDQYIAQYGKPIRESYVEGVYKLPVKNIIDYEKTLTVDEAIAQTKAQTVKKKKKLSFIKKKSDSQEVHEQFNNELLNYWNKQN